MTETLRDRDPWPVEGPVRVEREPPPAWDEHTVDQPNGHVYQSLEWAAHRAASGWLPRYIVESGTARASSRCSGRGPRSAGSARTSRAARSRPARRRRRAARLVEVAALLEADGRRRRRRRRRGARGPGRTPMRLAAGRLPPDRGDPAVAPPDVAAARPASTRQSAFEGIVEVDPAADPPGRVERRRRRPPRRAAGPGRAGEGFGPPHEPTPVALDRFYDLLLETGERRRFSFGPRSSFVGWWTAAHRAGHLVHLEAQAPGGYPLAGLAAVPPRPAPDDRPQRRPRGGPARPSGRAPPAPLAGDPARDPRGPRRDGPRRRRRGRGPARTARGRRRRTGLYQHKSRSGRSGSSSPARTRRSSGRNRYRAGRVMSKLSRAARPAAGRRRHRRADRVERGVTASATIDALLAAAEPREPRPLGELARAPRGDRRGSAARATAARRSGRRRSVGSRSAA